MVVPRWAGRPAENRDVAKRTSKEADRDPGTDVLHPHGHDANARRDHGLGLDGYARIRQGGAHVARRVPEGLAAWAVEHLPRFLKRLIQSDLALPRIPVPARYPRVRETPHEVTALGRRLHQPRAAQTLHRPAAPFSRPFLPREQPRGRNLRDFRGNRRRKGRRRYRGQYPQTPTACRAPRASHALCTYLL